MALAALRLRRAVSLSSSLIQRLSPTSAPTLLSPAAVTNPNPKPIIETTPLQFRHFRSSPISLYSSRSSFRDNNNSFGEEIGPDTILFEGCDYNHWLITMDFPKDPAPTREEMIETYLQTLAKVVGSYEEAKKKMYALSTTTYQGFQCLVSEEESEKFKGLPGVVFVLPDSYIDPANKEYGGDKYENGVITPRPPPQQFGRQRGGRYGDPNRGYSNNMRQMSNEQGNKGYENQGPRYGDNRNFGPQQTPPVPNQQFNQGYVNQGPRYGDNRSFGQQQRPPIPNQAGNQGYGNQGHAYVDNRNSGQIHNPSIQPNYGSGGDMRNPSVPPNQGNYYNQTQQEYIKPQDIRNQPDQRVYPGDNRNYAPPPGAPQGQGGNFGQVGGGAGQGASGNYGQMGGGGGGQGSGGDYGHMGGGGGQGSGGNYGQIPGGNYGQGAGGNYSQGYPHQQTEQRNNVQDEQRNYGGQMGQSGPNQGRY